MSTRKTHAILKALLANQYDYMNTVLYCGKPRNGGATLDFDHVANRATAYHAMQIRGKVTTNDDGSGSHGRGRTLWGT